MRVEINYGDKKYATVFEQNAPLTVVQLHEVARNASFFISQAYHDELVGIASFQANQSVLHGQVSVEFTKKFDECKGAPEAKKRALSRAMAPLFQWIIESDRRLMEAYHREFVVSRLQKEFAEVSKSALSLFAQHKDHMESIAEGSYDFTIHGRKITLILTYDDPVC